MFSLPSSDDEDSVGSPSSPPLPKPSFLLMNRSTPSPPSSPLSPIITFNTRNNNNSKALNSSLSPPITSSSSFSSRNNNRKANNINSTQSNNNNFTNFTSSTMDKANDVHYNVNLTQNKWSKLLQSNLDIQQTQQDMKRSFMKNTSNIQKLKPSKTKKEYKPYNNQKNEDDDDMISPLKYLEDIQFSQIPSSLMITPTTNQSNRTDNLKEDDTDMNDSFLNNDFLLDDISNEEIAKLQTNSKNSNQNFLSKFKTTPPSSHSDPKKKSPNPTKSTTTPEQKAIEKKPKQVFKIKNNADRKSMERSKSKFENWLKTTNESGNTVPSVDSTITSSDNGNQMILDENSSEHSNHSEHSNNKEVKIIESCTNNMENSNETNQKSVESLNETNQKSIESSNENSNENLNENSNQKKRKLILKGTLTIKKKKTNNENISTLNNNLTNDQPIIPESSSTISSTTPSTTPSKESKESKDDSSPPKTTSKNQKEKSKKAEKKSEKKTKKKSEKVIKIYDKYNDNADGLCFSMGDECSKCKYWNDKEMIENGINSSNEYKCTKCKSKFQPSLSVQIDDKEEKMEFMSKDFILNSEMKTFKKLTSKLIYEKNLHLFYNLLYHFGSISEGINAYKNYKPSPSKSSNEKSPKNEKSPSSTASSSSNEKSKKKKNVKIVKGQKSLFDFIK